MTSSPLVGSSRITLIVDERARQRHFRALALGESGDTPIRERLESEPREEGLGSLCERRSAEAVQLAEIADVLPRGQPRIQTA